MLLALHLLNRKHKHRWIAGESFRFVCILIAKLWSCNFIELDVCGRPLLANLVTYSNTVSTLAK